MQYARPMKAEGESQFEFELRQIIIATQQHFIAVHNVKDLEHNKPTDNLVITYNAYAKKMEEATEYETTCQQEMEILVLQFQLKHEPQVNPDLDKELPRSSFAHGALFKRIWTADILPDDLMFQGTQKLKEKT